MRIVELFANLPTILKLRNNEKQGDSLDSALVRSTYAQTTMMKNERLFILVVMRFASKKIFRTFLSFITKRITSSLLG